MKIFRTKINYLFFFLGCYLIRPVKSNCLNRLRTRTETTTIRRAAGLLPTEKDSKVSPSRLVAKNGKHIQRDDIVECQL